MLQEFRNTVFIHFSAKGGIKRSFTFSVLLLLLSTFLLGAVSDLTTSDIVPVKEADSTQFFQAAPQLFGEIIAFEAAPNLFIKPTLTITEPSDGIITQVDSVVVSGSVFPPARSTVITVNGQEVAVQPRGLFSTIVHLKEGSNTITIKALDKPGSTDEVVRHVTLDTTPPEVTILSPADSSNTNQQSITIDGVLSEVVSVFTINGDSVEVGLNGNFSVNVAIIEGENTFTFQAVDMMGNSTTEVLTITRVSDPPVLTVNNPAEGFLTLEDTLAVSGSVDHPGLTTVTVNGQSVTVETDGTFSTSVILVEGNNQITVIAENQDELTTEISRTVTLDTEGPIITFVTPSSDSSFSNQSQMNITGSLSEPISLLTINTDTVVVNPDLSFSTMVTLSEGQNTISAAAVDLVGNSTNKQLGVFGDFEAPELLTAVGIKTDSPYYEYIGVQSDDTLQFNLDEILLAGSILNELTDVTITINGDTVETQESSGGGNVYDFFEKNVSLGEGLNPFTIISTDQAGNSSSRTITIATPTTFDPHLTVDYPENNLVTDSSSVHIFGTLVDSSLSVRLTVNGLLVTMTQTGTYSYAFEHKVFLFPGNNYVSLRAVNANDNEAVKSLKIERDYITSIPPDPKTVAPLHDSTIVTTMYNSTEFLFKGDSVIQHGVEEGVIDPTRTSVVRGKVLDETGSPLQGVLITILDHAEYGYTLTRPDGMFDMAVNGGGPLTVRYHKNSYLPVQRQVDFPWQDFVTVDSVYMIQADSIVTTIDFSDTLQVARGSMVTDADGSRQATLLFKQGTEAIMVLPDGSTQLLDSINVRATEYTIGENGPGAMPAELPSTTGYTYAVEYSVDQALEAGANQVIFDKPVVSYLENFIGFPTGSIVPAGYYDRNKGQWIPSKNGKVIEITGITDGMADIDITGDGMADPANSLIAVGIDTTERVKLASLYNTGQNLWRVEITHFTPWDFNWPYGPPEDAEPPMIEQKEPNYIENDKSGCESGSVISVENQTLGEIIDITGAPCGLHYSSGTMRGYKSENIIPVKLTGSSVPSSLVAVQLNIEIAGKSYIDLFPAEPNQTYTFQWDGRDVYNRFVQGAKIARISIGYIYNAVYYQASEERRNAFANTGDQPVTGNREAALITLWQNWSTKVGQLFRTDFGGWKLGIHHQYDIANRMLYKGSGLIRGAEDNANIIREYLDESDLDGRPIDLAMGNEGNLFIAVEDNEDELYRIIERKNNGSQEIIVQFPIVPEISISSIGYSDGYSSNVNLAEEGDKSLTQIDVGPEGRVYFTDDQFNRVYRVNHDHSLEVIAGTGTFGYSGDNGPADSARINKPTGIAVASDGAVYIADSRNDVIRRIGTDGIISTFAGTGDDGFSGDGGPAIQAEFDEINGMDIGPNGTLYVADTDNHRIRSITPDGIINTVVGSGEADDPAPDDRGDGGLATEAVLINPTDVAVGEDGSLYIAEQYAHQIRKVTPDGIIFRLAGLYGENPYHYSPSSVEDEGGFNFNNGPAAATRLSFPNQITLGPNGSVYFNERLELYFEDKGNSMVRIIESDTDYFDGDENAIVSRTGSEIYVFDLQGKHLRTEDALNRNHIFEFEYDSAGLLHKIIDIDGLETIVERNTSGKPTAIIAPFGHRTELTIGTDGYLSSIQNPEGEVFSFLYTQDGLLTQMTDPKNNLTSYEYDSLGYFVKGEYPNGGFKEFSRQELPDGFEVTMTTAEGKTTTHKVVTDTDGTQTLTKTDAHGLETSMVYGSDGSKTVTSPDGATVVRSMKPDPRFGMQAPLTDTMKIIMPSGLTSVFSQTKTVTQMTGNEITGLTDSLFTNGKVTVSEYNGNQNVLTTTTPEGRQSFSYTDSLGRIIQSSVPGITPTNYSYNSDGFLTEVEQGGRSTSFTYNSEGYLETSTDPLGRIESTFYDSVGRVTRQVLPNEEEILYSYDENGNLVSIAPPEQPAHTFSYTEVDLTDHYEPPAVPDSAGGINYLYDLDKKLLSTVFSDSTSIQMVYDTTHAGSARPIAIHYDQGSTAFTYDSTSGNLTSVASSDSVTTSYSYDGSLTTQMTTQGVVNGIVNYNYNNDFQVISQSINGTNTVGYTYDDDGLLITAGALAMSYDPQNGLLTGTTLGDFSGSYSYNAFGELTGTAQDYNSSDLFDRSYGLDSLGRITSITETIEDETTLHEYVYNEIGYLVEVKEDGVTTAEYEYDSNGNRTLYVSEGDTISATYDSQDRMLTYGDASYLYGKRGDLQRKVEGTDTTHYNYDNVGNLRSVILPDDSVIEYVIDGQDRRVAKKVNGVITKRWLYADGLLPVAELDSAGNVEKRYVPGAIIKNDTTYRVIRDHLGSVRLVINSETGETVQRIDYNAWGQVTYMQNQDEFTNIGFAGGLYDMDTGLVRFGARDYDPEEGRWTAKDPILFDGGTSNLYEYALNDPVNNVDPDGLQPINNQYYIEVKRIAESPNATLSKFNAYGPIPLRPVSGYFLEPGGPATTIPDQDRRIPAGKYNVAPYSSRRFPNVYRISNELVSEDRNILIHAGNVHSETSGCFMPGSSTEMYNNDYKITGGTSGAKLNQLRGLIGRNNATLTIEDINAQTFRHLW